jgi:hypothetical protein
LNLVGVVLTYFIEDYKWGILPLYLPLHAVFSARKPDEGKQK